MVSKTIDGSSNLSASASTGGSSVGRMRHLGCCGRRFESCSPDKFLAGSTSWLSRRPFKAESRVRVPYRLLLFFASLGEWLSHRSAKPGTPVRIREEAR